MNGLAFSAIALTVFAALFALLARALVASRKRERARLAGVQVGDLWETAGGRWPGCYEVVEANDSREAGPDSWVMRRVTDDRTAYMHHDARECGEWWLVFRDGRPTELWFRDEHRRAPAGRPVTAP